MNKMLYTAIVIIYIMLFLSYYYGYLEFETTDEYYYFWYTYININEMKFSLNPPWYVGMAINMCIFPTIQFYMSYTKGIYTIGNYTTKLNCILYTLIKTVIMWCKAPISLVNIVYTYISRKFLNRPEYIYVDSSLKREIIYNNDFHCEKPDECCVCYEKLTKSDSKLSCGHYIHRTCIVNSKK